MTHKIYAKVGDIVYWSWSDKFYICRIINISKEYNVPVYKSRDVLSDARADFYNYDFISGRARVINEEELVQILLES